MPMSIFPLSSLLQDGEPVPDDGPIDTIGVTIDSAAGEGTIEHDGTAAIIYGMRQPRVAPGGFDGGSVVILDWDIRSLALGTAYNHALAQISGFRVFDLEQNGSDHSSLFCTVPLWLQYRSGRQARKSVKIA